ncbi:hypothetical protein B0H63DRAFT_525506 [Podospora didyma]|uniref:Uncharacterized protein n=1 Tax=Podospora didyma TaxID=330526 RepID=A0AAE0NC40_9PEZI|nr:hypothetical protein B0H63DRAFT_525506 [Podospora didyma]
MPSTKRDYYTTESTGRDFGWFSFRSPASTVPSVGEKAEPSPTYSTTTKRRRRNKMPPIAEEGRVIATPASGTRKPERLGPWSEWTESSDNKYFWRARQSMNGVWAYQYTEGYYSANARRRPPTISSPRMSSPLAITDSAHMTGSPKSSWPTITTTSTGRPTEVASNSSNQHTGSHLTVTSSVAKSPSILGPKKQPLSSVNNQKPTLKRRPVLLLPAPPAGQNKTQDNKNNNQLKPDNTSKPPPKSKPPPPKSKKSTMVAAKSKLSMAHTAAATSTAAASTAIALTARSQQAHAAAQSKRLHNKLKSEKELKIDTKKRVRNWLKDVELETTTPAPWDHPL